MTEMKKQILTLCLFALGACGGPSNEISRKEAPLDQRVSILELQKTLEPASRELLGDDIILPKPWSNEFWPQAGGYPNHAIGHVAFTKGIPKEIWSSSIGDSGNKRIPINTAPIVVDGKVFTVDASNRLAAFDVENGKNIWGVSLKTDKDDDDVIPGGIAFADGVIYATNGYEDVQAIAGDTGEILWNAKLPTPSRIAPTVIKNRVFVVTVDNRLIAFDARDGSQLWEHLGLSEASGLIGGASPAASNDIILPAFSSGEVIALRHENGSVAWADNLAGIKRAGGLSSITDIKALPVIEDNIVYAISFNGRLVAIDARTGTRIWGRNISGSETPWVAGNTVFVLTSEAQIVALNAKNGLIRWVGQLPRFADEEDREDPIQWMGPALAGERLIAASSEGIITEINPADGTIGRSWDTGEPIAFAPIIANGTLYVLGRNGILKAYK